MLKLLTKKGEKTVHKKFELNWNSNNNKSIEIRRARVYPLEPQVAEDFKKLKHQFAGFFFSYRTEKGEQITEINRT